ncbi:MAG: NAD-dependent protein deacylase [Clostridia bacterium]|nr:NAD-dependent protein deacylase [Clostridia bacterium]
MENRLMDLIKNSNRIVFFGGAGVSTASGIPDFRSENGAFEAIKKYGFDPETLLSHSFFMRYPDLFYDYYRNSLAKTGFLPNYAHYAIAELEKMGKLSAVITQNIDALHQMAGSTKVYELHGSIYRNYCLRCGKSYGIDKIHAAQPIPTCTCGGVIRPDVVLYEELLDNSVVEGAIYEIMNADMLIIGGTSLVVYPAASLIEYYRGSKLVLINKSTTPYDQRADIVINDAIEDVFKRVMQKII